MLSLDASQALYRKQHSDIIIIRNKLLKSVGVEPTYQNFLIFNCFEPISDLCTKLQFISNNNHFDGTNYNDIANSYTVSLNY